MRENQGQQMLIQRIYYLLLLVIFPISAMGDTFSPAVGQYIGVVQAQVDSNSEYFSTELKSIEFTVAKNKDLIFVKHGHTTILNWDGNKWIWKPENSQRVEAIPKQYGELLDIEYLAFENNFMVGGARFYLVKDESKF